ncbi:MAG: stage II sporulation protein M [Planctomycetota bacterium]
MKLKSTEFRREREQAWQELDRLVTRAEKSGIRSLGTRELARLPVLYRATLSSLSVARAISTDKNVIDYLATLSARAYVHVYGTKAGAGRTLVSFFAETFPRAVRRYRWHVLLSALFLLSGTLTGFLLTAQDPDRYYTFVGAMAQGRTPAATTEELRDVLYGTGDGGELTAFSAFLFTHNTQVGFLAFALGFLAGIPVFLLLFSTGLTLGALAALYHSRGLSLELWGWILPHGVTELTAVVLCGAGGLVIGQALIFPGERTRLSALARAGRKSGALVLGAIFMFLVAGLIEGVFRQTVQSEAIRYVLATSTALLWILYFTGVGRFVRRVRGRP